MKITGCPLLRFRTKAAANAVALHVICLDPAGDTETENPWENPWENAGKCWENDGKMLEHPVVYHLVPYDNCLFVYLGVDFLSPVPIFQEKKGEET